MLGGREGKKRVRRENEEGKTEKPLSGAEQRSLHVFKGFLCKHRV